MSKFILKFIERHLVLSIILTVTFSFGSFAAIVGYFDDPTTLVSEGEVKEWSKQFEETLRTLEFNLQVIVQSKISSVIETKATTTAAASQ